MRPEHAGVRGSDEKFRVIFPPLLKSQSSVSEFFMGLSRSPRQLGQNRGLESPNHTATLTAVPAPGSTAGEPFPSEAPSGDARRPHGPGRRYRNWVDLI